MPSGHLHRTPPGSGGSICAGSGVGPDGGPARSCRPRRQSESWLNYGVGGVCDVASLLAGGAGGRLWRELRTGPGEAG